MTDWSFERFKTAGIGVLVCENAEDMAGIAWAHAQSAVRQIND